MNYEEAIDQLKLVQKEIGNVTLAHSFERLVEKAERIVMAVELQPQHQPLPGSWFHANNEDIRTSTVQSLNYTLNREVARAKSAKGASAQQDIIRAIRALDDNISTFISGLE